MHSHIAVAALRSLIRTRTFRRTEDGQDLLEYAMLVALIALLAAGAVASVGNTIQTTFWTVIANGLSANA